MTIQDQADYLTRAQAAIRSARDKKDAELLSKAAAILDEPGFAALPLDAQEGLGEQYGRAYLVVTGALVG